MKYVWILSLAIMPFSVRAEDAVHIADLLQQERAARSAAEKKIASAIRSMEKKLIGIVEKREQYLQDQRDAVVSSIRLLGRLRSKKAVPILIRIIEFEAVAGSSLKEDGRYVLPWIRYPAVGALIQIGIWQPVIKELGVTGHTPLRGLYNKRGLLVLVLKKILGPEMAEVAVRTALEGNKNSVHLTNLRGALEYFKKKPADSGGHIKISRDSVQAKQQSNTNMSDISNRSNGPKSGKRSPSTASSQ